MVSSVLEKTQSLLRLPSVTPEGAGTLELLEEWLKPLGFHCERLQFEEEGTLSVDNLYARRGTSSPHFCFAGHVDVVPVGELSAWTFPPFEATLQEGVLYGRGASDMKGAIAAFVCAVEAFLASSSRAEAGSISFLITADEEGVAINGTRKVVDVLRQRGEVIEACIVGEPTNPHHMGEMVKIGRRGSLNGVLTVTGKQGHVAYPHLAHNPIPDLMALLSALLSPVLDEGNEAFPASNLEVTDIHVGNTTTNLIPQRAEARFNIRFNSEWSGETLKAHLEERLQQKALSLKSQYHLKTTISGESFLTHSPVLRGVLVQAIEETTGQTPQLSTTGGTSDARFIQQICPVVEYGLIGQTIHQINENTSVAALESLEKTYTRFLELFFEMAP